MAFARRQELQAQPLQLSSAIEAIKPMLERVVGAGVSMVCVLDPALGIVRADPARIEQMLLKFVLNARDAMPAGGRITVETRNVTLGAEEAARMRPVGNARVVPGEYVVRRVLDAPVATA
jgi:signal transduction histidine kinase